MLCKNTENIRIKWRLRLIFSCHLCLKFTKGPLSPCDMAHFTLRKSRFCRMKVALWRDEKDSFAGAMQLIESQKKSGTHLHSHFWLNRGRSAIIVV